MKRKTVVSSTVIDKNVKDMMDAYIEDTGVLTAAFLEKALDLYEEVGCKFEVYEIMDPVKFPLRIYDETKGKVDKLAKERALTRNIIWNQAIKDYLYIKK